ncbi:MAG: rhodanese-like domain-containing protein [Bacteroidota bacterium]
MFNGLDAWLQLNDTKQLAGGLIERKIRYKLLDSEAFNTSAATGNTLILDIRPVDEFENKSSEGWRNRGRIKGSVNIPAQSLANAYPTLPKTKPIIITGFGSNSEAFEAAEFLITRGFNNVHVLTPGIWGLRYQAFNYPNSRHLDEWVIDVPEENR